jgi:hypothetical protein
MACRGLWSCSPFQTGDGRPSPSFIWSICAGREPATMSASNFEAILSLYLPTVARFASGMNCGEAGGSNEGVEIGRLGHDVFELLHRTREVVVGVERATLQFRPAVLTRKRNARRLIGLLAGKRVLNALHAAVVIGRSGAARPDAHRAALGLDLHADLGKIHADLVVVRAGVGDCSGSRDQRDVQAIRTRSLIPF